MTSSPKPLNVVFIFSDQHRFDYTGYNGADWIHTPNLDRMASNGTVLEKFYSTSPLCAPQRISLITGRYCVNTGCYGNRHSIDPNSKSFLQNLQAAGIKTAQVGKLHLVCHGENEFMANHNYINDKIGWDYHHETGGKQGTGMIRTRCHYSDYLSRKGILEKHWEWSGTFSSPGTKKGEGDPWPWEEHGAVTVDEYITQKAEEYLDKTTPDQPFFLQVGICGPHPPFDAPERYRPHYKDAKPWYTDQLSEQDLEDWRAYCACITEVDEKVGRILKSIEDNGLAENTIVLYTADHGEFAGERKRWHKGPFHEPSSHVPFIAMGPGISKDRKLSAMGEVIDIGKTVCDFMGIESHHYDQGESMKATLLGEKDTHRKNIYCEMGSDKMLYDGRYKLMFGDVLQDKRKEWLSAPYNGPGFGRPVNLPPDELALYDIENDPKELNDLSKNPEHKELLNEMIFKLASRMIENTQSRPMDMHSVM